jgi:hypothetical protein
MLKKLLFIFPILAAIVIGSYLFLHSSQTKNLCSDRLGFCSNVPGSWEVSDTQQNKDLKTLVSNFRCEGANEKVPADNANSYGASDAYFSVLKLRDTTEIMRDDTLTCLVNKCSDLSTKYNLQEKNIHGKDFTFMQDKTDPSVTKIYLKSGDGYYAFYFDEDSFPACGKKQDPEQVLNKFLEDFSLSGK